MKVELAMPIFFLDVIVFSTLIVLPGKRTCTPLGGGVALLSLNRVFFIIPLVSIGAGRPGTSSLDKP